MKPIRERSEVNLEEPPYHIAADYRDHGEDQRDLEALLDPDMEAEQRQHRPVCPDRHDEGDHGARDHLHQRHSAGLSRQSMLIASDSPA